MHKIYSSLSIFYALEDSAWCYSIQILAIGDFNSFGVFWDTLYVVMSHHFENTISDHFRGLLLLLQQSNPHTAQFRARF